MLVAPYSSTVSREVNNLTGKGKRTAMHGPEFHKTTRDSGSPYVTNTQMVGVSILCYCVNFQKKKKTHINMKS